MSPCIIRRAIQLIRPFVNPIALSAISWRYYAVYIAIDFVIAVIAYLHFPETRRLTIEEISLMFDYGTKEGRQMALQHIEHSHEPRMGKDMEDGDGMDKGKPGAVHLEDSRAR